MAKKYLNTYDDLLKDMKANNITFSDYDLALAQKNPDAGRSLYSQKLAYGQATTDEERQKANDAANLIRQQYGGYSGGSDGTGFTLSQTYVPPASDYVSKYQSQIDDWTDKLLNQGPYTSQYQDQIDDLTSQITGRDPYNSQYQGKIDDLLTQLTGRDPYQSAYQAEMDRLIDDLLNREEFSYNPAADASYQAYSEKYRNAGNQAMQNALGSAAVMTGGQLSSYAMTAAQQAQNAYAAQMSDVIPELQQLAYEMYMAEGDTMRQNLSTLVDQDNALLALMSQGTSVAAQGGSLAAGTGGGIMSTAGNALRSMAKDPMYWSSAAQTLGTDYEENKANGATDLEAAVSAIISTAVNAGIERGGGLEVLPSSVKKGGNSTISQWVKSMFEEGQEEVVQSVMTGITQKLTYDHDKALYSATDQNAVVNPGRLAQEFGMGAAVGGVLGGAQMGAISALNAATGRNQVQNQVQDEDLNEDLDEDFDDELNAMLWEMAKKKYGVTEEVSERPQDGFSEPVTVDTTPSENVAQGLKSDALGPVLVGGKRVPNTELTEEQIAAWDNRTDIWMDAEDNVYQMDPEEHITRRTVDSVGNQKVKAFQFDHPELRQYYKAAAEDLVKDASLSLNSPNSRRPIRDTQGKRYVNEILESPAMRSAMDLGLSRNQIIKAAEDLIADHGQENNAAAKRLELVLDKMLTEGYATVEGQSYGPNDGYIQAKAEIPGYQVKQGENLPLWDMDSDAYGVYNSLDKNGSEVLENGSEAVHLRDSGQWSGSAYPGGQVSGVESSAGENQGWQGSGVAADPEAATLTYGERVSTASQGIAGGSREAKIRLVKGGDTAAIRQAKKLARERGLRLILFGGNNMEIKRGGEVASVRAYITGDRVFVRADHPLFTADQLMRHEAGHDMIAKGEIDPNQVRKRIRDTFGKDKVVELSRMYADAYEGSGLTAAEIWEEVICDSLADMNIFAETLQEDVAAELLDETSKATDTASQVEARGPPAEGRASFAGTKAATANIQALENAKIREKRGEDSETIRKSTGWFRGADGKWRWEIDDSGMDFRKDGDARLMQEPEYQRLQELTDKWARSFEGGEALTEAETNEMDQLSEQYEDRVWEEKYLLRDFLKHDELFQAYPYLNRVSVVFDGLSEGVKGFFSKRSNTIVLSDSLFGKDAEVLLHELQHVIQHIEGFSSGSSVKYWRERVENGFSRRWASGEEMMPSELYHRTAGEIEARDTASRRELDKEGRRTKAPNLGDENTVFADGAVESFDFVGKTAGGVEVYETNEDVRRMPYKQRMETFMEIMRNEYRGRTAKFTANGDVFYAKFAESDLRKNVHGDKRSSKDGWKAKINTGASGNIFELVENAKYKNSAAEQGKTTSAHKNVSGWAYFVKTVQIDGRVYDLLANVRKKPDGEYVYSIQLTENKNKAPAPPLAPAYGSKNGTGYAQNGVPTNASDATISQTNNTVNQKNSQETHSTETTEEQQKTLQDVQEATRQAVREELDRLGKEYGWIKAGENPFREVKVPKQTSEDKKVSQTVRTVMEAEATPEDFIPLIEAETVKEGFSFVPISNDETTRAAQKYILDRGWATALKDWTADVRKGRAGNQITAVGALLYNNAVNAGDYKAALDILTDYQMAVRNSARGLQAARILKTLTPENKLHMIRKDIRSMVETLDLPEDIDLPQDLVDRFMEAKTEEEINEAVEDIQQYVADQIPSTLLDKWTALRYMNMLGNFKTQVRNVSGNIGMRLVGEVENLVATGLETIVGRKTGRTRSVFVGKELRKLAAADFQKVKDQALGDSKYTLGNESSSAFASGVKDKQRVFKTEALEKYRKATNWAMNNAVFGDEAFSRSAYARALSGYLKAKGVSAELFGSSEWQKKHSALVDEARNYAIKRAQELTFRDHNTFSDWISKIGRRPDTPKAAKMAAEGILPFRRTPANVLVRAEEYSPLGLVNTAVQAARLKLGAENVTGTDVINSLSKALTGTGIFIVGMALQNAGWLRGGEDEDEEKAAFKDLTGHQTYSLELPDGTSITLDWLTPASMPLFMGAQLERLRQDGEIELKDLEQALLSIANPMLQMSMMQGLNDTLEDLRYMENANLMQFAVTAGLSYLTQGITNSLVGQVARTLRKESTMTYVDKESAVPGWLQREIGAASRKVPGPGYNQIAYIDAWGRTESTESVAERAANNLLNPSYVSKVEESKMEKELLRLYEVTGLGSVLPSAANKYFTVNGIRKDLTAEEYVKYATKKGQTSYQLAAELTGSKAYQRLTDEEKADAVAIAFDYANQTAKASITSKAKLDNWVKAARTIKAECGISKGTFFALKAMTADVVGLKQTNRDGELETIQNSKSMLLMEMLYNSKAVTGLTDEQRKKLFEYLGVGESVSHYTAKLVEQKLNVMRNKAG